MRKVITLFLIMLFVFSMAGFASAEPANITEALATANDELRAKFFGGDYFFTENVQGKRINEANWAKNRLFSYGTPQEASPGSNDYDPITNQYRYHGYTRNGEKYTNTFFRNDTNETVDLNNSNWIIEPWRNNAVQNFVTNVMHEPELTNNPFNNDPELLKSIIMGMENVTQYNPSIKFKRDSRQWQEYVHILQPPTMYTFGMGRLFRIVGGQIRYLTIPLTPFSLIPELPNLAIGDINPGFEGEVAAGTKCTGWFEVINESNQSFQNVPVGLWNNGWKARTKNAAGTLIETIDIGPNETVKVYFEYTVQEGKSTLVAKVDRNPLPETIEETTKEDNTGEIEVLPKALPAPPSNGVLTFQARSQGGKDLYGKYIPPTNRPVNTAMWEDMVTATLKPPAPTPPKGTLKSWSITSATITIPKQHPRFSFGTPYPPVSTETLTMNPGGHTATALFKETWGIDGFNRGGSPGVYSPIEKKVMAAKPKTYTITANYTIKYTYEWQEKRRSCSTGSNGKRKCRTYYVTKSATGTTSGTATGSLLVNGAGRIPF